MGWEERGREDAVWGGLEMGGEGGEEVSEALDGVDSRARGGGGMIGSIVRGFGASERKMKDYFCSLSRTGVHFPFRLLHAIVIGTTSFFLLSPFLLVHDVLD